MADPLALSARAGLPEDMRVLLTDVPRDRWDQSLPEMARFWLQMHQGFRQHHAHMAALTTAWRQGQLDVRGLHGRLIPALQQFLQHLDGHHRIESGQYFPAMARVEPRIATGIALLDRDHEAIHQVLENLFKAGLALHQGLAGPDAGDRAARLGDVIERAQTPLARHLDDEEEIVIPLIALKGDQLA